jgi:hypothetical protein
VRAVFGVPAELDLSSFVGKQLSNVTIGEFMVGFGFCPGVGAISVYGAWEASGPDGAVFDRSQPNEERTEYRVHRLLGRDVTGFHIDAPRSLELELDGGYRLRLISLLVPVLDGDPARAQ